MWVRQWWHLFVWCRAVNSLTCTVEAKVLFFRQSLIIDWTCVDVFVPAILWTILLIFDNKGFMYNLFESPTSLFYPFKSDLHLVTIIVREEKNNCKRREEEKNVREE